MNTEEKTLAEVRKIQKKIESFFLFHIFPRIIRRSIRKTRHFREWFCAPMNYVRMIELPLSILLMDLNNRKRILDISSPKLLSLYLALQTFPDITISDIEDYFVKDFEVFRRVFNFSARIKTFDATRIPLKDNSFDRVFSISVLEHVPDDGDIKIAKEAARVLSPGGLFVITIPAWNKYLEEYLKSRDFYWQGKTRDDGSVFFQRRYDEKNIRKRFNNIGFEIEDLIFIAEKPIREPELSENGRLLYNAYYLNDLTWVKALKKLTSKLYLPLLPYFAHRYLSNRCHYLTRDGSDKNIRQAAVKFRKKS